MNKKILLLGDSVIDNKSYDLDAKKIEKYREDIASTCHFTPGAYNFLIDLQIKGTFYK